MKKVYHADVTVAFLAESDEDAMSEVSGLLTDCGIVSGLILDWQYAGPVFDGPRCTEFSLPTNGNTADGSLFARPYKSIYNPKLKNIVAFVASTIGNEIIRSEAEFMGSLLHEQDKRPAYLKSVEKLVSQIGNLFGHALNAADDRVPEERMRYHPQALLEETIQHLRRHGAANDVIELLERSV